MVGDDRAKHLLGSLEDAQRLGIWEWLPATDEMVWSDGLYEILDVSPRIPPTLAGLIATIHPTDQPKFENLLARARRERGLLALRCQTVNGGGKSRILQVRMQRTLAADGSLRSIVGTNQDITDEALATDPVAAVAAITGAIAHEINNPLAVISAVLQMLPKTDPTNDALRAVDRIHSVITDLNLYSHGDRAMARGTVRLEQLIPVAFSQIPELHSRATIVTRLDRTRPVRANVGGVCRMLVELIQNALDAVSQLAVKEVHVATRADGREWAVVEITDNGVGIAPVLQARIFDPFYTTKGVGRRGLGLSICRGIVESIGGSINVHSHAGGGTRIVVALPASETSAPVQLRALDENAKEIDRDRGRVLVVDDEVLFANALGRLLGTEHEVTIVGNGKLALDLVEGGTKFDVIVCDLTMPVMTGNELHERLLDVAPEQARRMIFVSGGARDEQSAALLAAVESFEKPCDVKVLRDAVRRHVAANRRR
jgi:signal transduction histidine kinase